MMDFGTIKFVNGPQEERIRWFYDVHIGLER